MASSISAARTALHDILASHSGLAGIQVSFGPPDAYEQNEVVALLGIESAEEEDAAVGAQRTEERYELVVRVKVYTPDGTAEEADVRGFLLADEVRAAVNQNHTLNSAVRWATVRSQSSEGALPADPSGWVIFLDLRVRCSQRIT